MPETLAVGKDIDAQCTRCKLLLAHTILAMVGTTPVRVKCNTCHTNRNYKAPRATKEAGAAAAKPKAATSKTGTGTKTAAKPARPSAVETAWELEQKWIDVLGQARRVHAQERPFALTTTFTLGQVILHSKFGDGVVVGIDGSRMTVRFKDGEKMMAHGRV